MYNYITIAMHNLLLFLLVLDQIFSKKKKCRQKKSRYLCEIRTRNLGH